MRPRSSDGPLKTRTLPREHMLTIANLVAAGQMPKDKPLVEADRSKMLNEIIDALAPDAEWATNARAYWVDGFRGSRTHNFGSVRERIAQERGFALTPEERTRTIEEILEGDLVTVTPSFMTEVGLIALNACRSLVADKVRYRECLRTATAPDEFLVR